MKQKRLVLKKNVKENLYDMIAIIIFTLVFLGAVSIIAWNNKRIANDIRYQQHSYISEDLNVVENR